jgi:hypothetical protein
MANTVSIVLSPQGRTIPGIPWTPGMSVRTALERASGLSSLGFSLAYGGPNAGYRVHRVGDLTASDGESWNVRRNGMPCPADVDSLVLNAGDVVDLSHVSGDGESAGSRSAAASAPAEGWEDERPAV